MSKAWTACRGGSWHRSVCRRPLTARGGRGITADMLIFKMFRGTEWAELRAKGETLGAPIDVADGYVHFSTAAQAAETAAKHFAGEDDLFLLALDTEPLDGDLKWETSRGGQKFPHLYRPLRLADVVWAQPLPLVDGAHQFPPGLDEAAG